MYALFEREKIKIGSSTCFQWSNVNPRACIIFIHGLGGNANKTWQNLPTLLMGTLFAQNKDIYLYSYESRIFNIQSKKVSILSAEFTTFLENISPKYDSFYFVSHSLGSLICISAMLNLLGRDHIWISKLKSHVMLAPAIFGSWFAYFDFISPTTRGLWPNNKTLKEISRDWRFQSKLTICKSFVLTGSKDIYVPKNATQLEYMGIKTHQLSESHISIPKTNSIENQTYRAILDCLYESAESNLSDSRSYISSIVYDSNPESWEFDDGLRTFIFKPNYKLKIIQFNKRAAPRTFIEPWVQNFPNKEASMIYYQINYDNHGIEDFPMVQCDGGRYLIPLPKSINDLTISSKQYKLAQIMEKEGFYSNLDQGLQIAKINIK